MLGVVNVVGGDDRAASASAGSTCTRARKSRWLAPRRSPHRHGVRPAGAALGRMRDLSAGQRQAADRGAQGAAGQGRADPRAGGGDRRDRARAGPAPSMLFIGRRRGWPVAREGAQKLKEISYIHAEAYASAELKHGPLALVSQDMPTVVVVPRRRPVRQERVDAGRDQGPPRPGDRDAHRELPTDVGPDASRSRSRGPSWTRSAARCRCSSSPTTWRWRRSATSTSPATWRSSVTVE